MSSTEASRLLALQQYEILGTPPEPNFDRITNLSGVIFGTAFCTLNLVDAERLWIKSHYGIEVSELPRSMSFCDYTVRGDDVLVVPDATLDSRFNEAPIVAGAPNIRFYAGAPLITPDNHRIGTLCLLDHRLTREFTAEDGAILANLAATAMELIEARSREIKLADMTRQISHLAHHDALTGLANRRHLSEQAQAIVLKGGSDEEVALLYVDLDGFKAVNDSKGHLVGDQLLVQVAGRLREALRAEDTIARVGGDEFVILMHQRGDVAARASLLAARLIERMSDPFFVSGNIISIGASIGITVDRNGASSLETMLSQADAMLYEVKAAGRGHYRFADVERALSARAN